jgi:hypothetical protein
MKSPTSCTILSTRSAPDPLCNTSTRTKSFVLPCKWSTWGHYHRLSTELPSVITSNTNQSTSIPFSRNIFRASSAIASNPVNASARIVGPAPERQIPNSPGCVLGVMEEVTSGKPGIWGDWSKDVRNSTSPSAYQTTPVWLVDTVFHGFINKVRVRRRP